MVQLTAVMKILSTLIVGLVCVVGLNSNAQENAAKADNPVSAQHSVLNTAEYLQKISVTIKSDSGSSRSEGSGVLVVKEIEGEQISFVVTAAHVVDNLRTARKVVDPKTGTERVIVEFKDAAIVRELVENGRRVGEIEMDAKVVRYSDADTGEDIAILMVHKRNYAEASAKFYWDPKQPIVPISTRLFHVGSLLGQMGSNSMTFGGVSQIGRMIGKKEYDQTTVTAFPGSSGGGVYLEDGRYMGMLVRGAGEGFNLVVPIRRIRAWAEDANMLWIFDENEKTPTLQELEKIPVEDVGHSFSGSSTTHKEWLDGNFPTWLYVTKTEPIVSTTKDSESK